NSEIRFWQSILCLLVFRTWQEYKDGFGSLTSDHWLGLDKLYYLTNSRDYTGVFYMRLVNSSYYQHYYREFDLYIAFSNC
ncbi:fibrinogen-like protein A, partial [Patella vulgata]|uniref:fibrinogen-like protein A n=1 Tax=Patella vulgata TaxID=6465 RepID=UPI0021801220